MVSPHFVIDQLKQENAPLCALTPRPCEGEWTKATGCMDMIGDTPLTTQLNNIHAWGAEDTTDTELSDHVSKLPLMAILERPTPDSSSRQLSFASSNTMFTPRKDIQTPEKENYLQSLQSECTLCYRTHRSNVAIKTCQCGRDGCTKWAHATCLRNRKSGNVSSCVSHPGTPAPLLPMILCEGIWRNHPKDTDIQKHPGTLS